MFRLRHASRPPRSSSLWRTAATALTTLTATVLAAPVLAGTGLGVPFVAPAAPAAAATTSAGPGPVTPAYWMLTDNGGVMTFGGTQIYGAATNIGSRVVGLATTGDGQGYWIAAASGAVSGFGDAPFLGSVVGWGITSPVVAITATPGGGGYWEATADGAVAGFGDAHLYGMASGLHLAQPIVGMASTPDGRGYWLVARDGGIFSFGDARFFGSTGAMRLNQPIVGMDSFPDGNGYWLVARDGGIFTFGDAPFYGSTGGMRLNSPIVGMSRVPGGAGYWLVGADGGVFAFGSAPFRGSVGGIQLLHPVVAIEEGPGSGTGVGASANEGLGPYPSGSTGYDISWPQCGGGYPGGHLIGIVGVNDGHAFSANPCLGDEVAWAGPAHALYLNLNSPNGSSAGQGSNGPAGPCSAGAPLCFSYNYGWNAAVNSVATASQSGAMAQNWWLDIETGNYWSGNTAANARVVQGAIDALHSRGLTVGVYSTGYQWGVITGGAQFGVPEWVATGISLSNASSWCGPSHAFTGGPVWLVQGGLNGFDWDYAC